jgi:hypothetical protein
VIAMPVKRGQDKQGPYYQWGDSGKKYHYTPGDKRSRDRAKEQASKQGQAAHARGYGG